MAEDTTGNDNPDTISRQALGRIARLGGLYNARTDTFCATTMFTKQLPPDLQAVSQTDNHSTVASVDIVKSFHQKLHKLDVKGELKLSVLSGSFEYGGCGKYLNKEKTSFKSVEGTLICKITTMQESLELFNTDLKPYISLDALSHSSATHVVVEIYWGANCAIAVTDQNSENNTKQEVEGNMALHLQKLKQLFSTAADANAQYSEEESDSWNKFSFVIFGDVLPDNSDEFPHTLDGALSMMRKMRQLIQNCNDGKGKPLTYVMFPLSSPAFRNYIGLKDTEALTVRNLSERRIIQVIHLFDHITELKQKVHDQVDEGHIVTSSEFEEARFLEEKLEIEQATVRSELAQLIKEVRSVNSDDQRLGDFCNKHDTTLREYQDVFKTIQSRTEFAKRCKLFGAEYLQHPLDQRIASARDNYENVYVLFDRHADAKTTNRNRSAFIELTKNHQLDSTTNCYFTFDSTGDTKIKHYWKDRLVHGDVAKELETKDVAVSIPALRRACCLMPFEVRCPGSFDGDCSKQERTWTCINCHEVLQFSPVDSELHCGCGHAEVDQFQFRCRSETHDFAHFGKDELHELVALLTSRSGDYFLFFGRPLGPGLCHRKSVCPSVRLSVCPSVTLVYCGQTA